MAYTDTGFHEYDIGNAKARLDTFRWFLALQDVRAKVGKPGTVPGMVDFDPLLVAAEFAKLVNDGGAGLEPAMPGTDAERPRVSVAETYRLVAQLDTEFDRAKKNIDETVNSPTSAGPTTCV